MPAPEKAGEGVEDRQNRFLIEFRHSFTDKAACLAAGISQETVCRWKRNDVNNFTAQYEEANQDRGDYLESRMFDALLWATEDAQYDKLLRNPGLLQFALRGAKPEKYGEKNVASQEDARRIFEELAKLKYDTPGAVVGEGKTLDDELKDILGFE